MLESFPENRFVALEELSNLLGFTRSEWTSLCKLLKKADEGFLEFYVGDMTVTIQTGKDFETVNDCDRWIRISYTLVRDKIETHVVHNFGIRELEALSRKKNLKVISSKKRSISAA
jgi:hypothetical protein